MGKLLEVLIGKRMMADIEMAGNLSDQQFGFRKSRNTIDALKETVVGTRKVKAGHRKFGLEPELTKTERKVGVKYILVKGEEIKMSCGVLQGSILGPLLWNVPYNGALELELSEGAKLRAYPDDLLIITAKDEMELESKIDICIGKITRWMKQNRLELAPEKTEAMFFYRIKRIKDWKIRVEGKEIENHAKLIDFEINPEKDIVGSPALCDPVRGVGVGEVIKYRKYKDMHKKYKER
ncbi:uncharacterized protein [Euwallacea similis]|uniref:uncharacterized protein n=1 Tax=Euwallacea similis TaxID=1736056 RepID=UPI00344C3891